MVGLRSIHNWISSVLERWHRRQKIPKIELYDLWALDETLARIIAVYLKEFRTAVSWSGATPGTFVLKNGMDGGKAWREWSGIIDKMIFAFDNYRHPYPHQKEDEYQERKVREGMQLFVEYFRYLNY